MTTGLLGAFYVKLEAWKAPCPCECETPRISGHHLLSGAKAVRRGRRIQQSRKTSALAGCTSRRQRRRYVEGESKNAAIELDLSQERDDSPLSDSSADNKSETTYEVTVPIRSPCVRFGHPGGDRSRVLHLERFTATIAVYGKEDRSS